MERILVTGGAGFIGSHLVDELLEEGYEVTVVDDLSSGNKKNLNPKARFYKVDIRSSGISRVLQKERPDVIYHYAAQINVRESVKDPIEDAKINILGSLNIIQKFVGINQFNRHKLVSKKFIFASSGGAIYGDADVIPTPESYSELPVSPYGVEKLAIDKYLNYYFKVFGLPFVSLRFANVYGPRQNSKGEAGVIAIFADKMLALYRTKGSGSGLSGEQPIINGSGAQTRDFVYVKDVIKASILALKKNKVGIFNISTAQETDINTIFRKLKELTGSNCKEVHGPEKPGEQKRSCLSFERAKELLGWQPKYGLEQGLGETIEYFRNED